jgi:adenine-specific DNA-methyltransferase
VGERKLQKNYIRYAGNKRKIVPKILSLISELNVDKVLDGFSGSIAVSQALKNERYVVGSNDISVYSKVFGECFLLNRTPQSVFVPLIEELNSLTGIDGWFTSHYGGYDMNGSSVQKDGKKRPFQIHNTKKIDAIREKIDSFFPNDCIEKSVLITSLILSMDKVSNDMGHQVSYLKTWTKKSYGDIILEVPNFKIDNLDHKVYQKTIFDVEDKYDLVYVDPPYGTSNKKTPTSRVRYQSYYHLWTTICLNDKPNTVGVANRRHDASSDKIKSSISEFENLDVKYVEDAFIKLIDKFKDSHIIISYNNRSKVTIDKLLEIFDKRINNHISFPYKENAQTNAVLNSKYKIVHKEPLKEHLFLLNPY